MSNVKHTSGPWQPGGAGQNLEVQSEDGWAVAICVPNQKISMAAYANAKFIAAAPDIADELKNLISILEEKYGHDCINARAALAKAGVV